MAVIRVIIIIIIITAGISRGRDAKRVNLAVKRYWNFISSSSVHPGHSVRFIILNLMQSFCPPASTTSSSAASVKWQSVADETTADDNRP